MTIILDGTNGVSDVDGSASTPAVRGTDANTGVFFPAADTVAMATGGSERVRVDSSGNVGIGTSSPSFALDIATSNANIRVAPSITTNNALTRYINAGGTGFVGLDNSVAGISTAYALNVWHTGAYPVVFGTNSTERARITSGGNFLIKGTTALADFVVQGQGAFGSTGSGGNGIYLYINNAASDNSYLSRVSSGSGTTTWYIGNQAITTSSDARLKANIKPSERNALELLQQWEIIDHTWNDPSDQSVNNKNSRGVWTGVVAQQVQSITPWLVNKPTEEIDKDGSINPWTMDFGYAVPLLVKAIQEQQALIQQLTERVAALEAKGA